MRLSTRTMPLTFLLAVIFAVAIQFLPACGDADTALAPEGVKVPGGILHCPVCLETDLQVGQIKGRDSSNSYWDTDGTAKGYPGIFTDYHCVNNHLFHTICYITDYITDPIATCIVELGRWSDR